MAVLFSNKGQPILVDPDVAEKLKGRKIHLAATKKYPMTVINGEHMYLHRYIMGVSDRKVIVDHINGDIYDDRRKNLRLATKADNAHNMRCLSSHNHSGYKGVFFENFTKRWCASIQLNGKKINLGRYKTAREAADAYDKKAIEIFGDFACTNEELRKLGKVV